MRSSLPALLLVISLASCRSAPNAASQPASSPADDAAALAAIDPYWSRPQNRFEAWVVFWTESQVDDLIRDLSRECSEKCPLSEEQSSSWRQACLAAAQPLVREYQVDLMLYGLLQEAQMGRRQNRERWNYAGSAEFRFDSIVNLSLSQYCDSLLDRHGAEWDKVAGPEQKEATHEYLFGERLGLFNIKKDARNATAEKRRRALDDEVAAFEMQNLRIDPEGPKGLNELSPLEYKPWDLTWHYVVASFVFDHRLAPPQQESAKTILQDCRNQAEALPRPASDEVQRRWKVLVQAYLFPKKSKVSVQEAMREYRRVAEASVRPIHDDMRQRLDALLTSEQRKSKDPPLPKPPWMEFMAIILEDRNNASSQPSP